jgi:hypothetical protein
MKNYLGRQPMRGGKFRGYTKGETGNVRVGIDAPIIERVKGIQKG